MKKLIVLWVVALAVPAAASSVDLINGDLETGDLTGWTTFDYNYYAYGKAEVVGSLGGDPADKGAYVLEINDYHATVSAASDVWVADTEYTVTLDIWNSPGDFNPFISVNPGDNGNPWSGWGSGSPWRIGIGGLGETLPDGWIRREVTFTTEGAGGLGIGQPISVGFQAWSGSANVESYVRLDNIKLTGPQVFVDLDVGDGVEVAESGETTDTFTVVLVSPPQANVTVTVDPNANDAGPAEDIVLVGAAGDHTVTLDFTPGNYSTPQTVTVQALDDLESEPGETTIIEVQTSSSDPNFDAIVEPVTVSIVDDDSIGFIAAQHVGNTDPETEGWTFNDFIDPSPGGSVSGSTDPEAHVRIQRNAGAAGRYLQTLTGGVFSNPNGWTYTARAKALKADGVFEASLGASDASSYWTLHLVANSDLGNPSGVYLHDGTQLVALDPNQGFRTYQIVFDPAGDGGNGSATYYLDGLAIGSQTRSDVWTPTGFENRLDFGDNDRNGISDSSWALVKLEVGQLPIDPPVIITETSGTTEVLEGDVVGDSYTVQLASQPAAAVSVALAESAGQVDLDPTSLTFTTGDWATPQTVTVTAVDDLVLETDPHATTISHSFSSGDPTYEGLVAAVSVSVLENDCGAWGFNPMDFDGDCEVGLPDFAALALQWLACTRPNDPACNNLAP